MVQQREPQLAEASDEDAGAATPTLHRESLHCDVNATRTLQSSSRAPAEARTFVAERTCPQHDLLAMVAAALVASEVVTHAVLSGDGPITIALQCHVTTLTLSVTCSLDGPPETPELRLADPIAGRIVDRICRSSGALCTDHGLTMWFTIPTGYLPVRTPRARKTPHSNPPVSSRPQTIPNTRAEPPVRSLTIRMAPRRDSRARERVDDGGY
jgi:hypothetical protein